MTQDSPHIMLFDLYSGGHHGHYLEYLVQHWARRTLPGRLSIVVPEHFLQTHVDLKPLAEEHAEAGVRLHVVREEVGDAKRQPFGLLRSDLEHGRLLRKHVSTLQPDHCLLMYFDHVQISLTLGLRFDHPVQFSGIYFRPTFHYRFFEGSRLTFRDRIRDLRKKLLLHGALRNPHFANLFCLDPFAVPHVQELTSSAHALALPDGVAPERTEKSSARIRHELGVADERQMLLLFGVLDRRKGLPVLLKAAKKLKDATANKSSLVLAGPIEESIREEAYAKITDLERETPLQIVLRDAFISDKKEIQDLFGAADVALLPYVDHVGSSNILVRAATEQIPVIGAQYGLLGEQIRRRRLGMAVDTSCPKALADGIETVLSVSPQNFLDVDEAKRFAQENTVDRFTETILKKLR